MLNKKIQITENVVISLYRCNAETLGVDIVRFYFKGELVGTYISTVFEKRASVCLYELVDEVASEEAKAFLLECSNQKEILKTLKGLKDIRKDLTNEDKAIFNVYLKAFDVN
jgi:hypothetical protein|tara:strand:+ start:160 stop:495 length:336 start_codon:yes stop_codon:yes gene_type:complete